MPSSAAVVGCIQRLRPPVLRHQAEAQITICAKPGAHEAHMGRTWGAHGAHMGRTWAYARRTPGAKKKLKSLYLVVLADWGWGRSN